MGLSFQLTGTCDGRIPSSVTGVPAPRFWRVGFWCGIARRSVGAAGSLALKNSSDGGKSRCMVRSRVFIQLAGRCLDKFSSGPAVIRVDRDADAYAEGGLLLVGVQSGLNALRDLFGHPLV